MSELKSTLFGETDDKADNESEVIDDNSEPAVPEDVFEPVNVPDDEEEPHTETPEEAVRESMDAVKRMKIEIAAENAVLNDHFSSVPKAAPVPVTPKRRPVYVIGVLSGAASLIFMGIVLLISLLTSPVGVYAAIKWAPVMLVFAGIDILYAVLRKRSLRIKLDIRSVVIIAVLIALSCALSVVSVNASAGTGERIYAERRLQNMLASELHDTIAKDYIKSVDIETQLFGENAEMYNTPADLNDGDIINLTIHFADAGMTIREFAKECKDIIDDIHKLSYNFGKIDFIADDAINHYALNIDWHYQSDFSADKLAALVNYFGNDISDTDIPDIVDDE
ncbi:MAG: YwiC-like family protein [Ruminiclostridium sp.]|nr:YwiC-like family protein [Ruminiclostridium sp.]